jgi:ABC-type spermidine/putrescine transport system permease subunit I
LEAVMELRTLGRRVLLAIPIAFVAGFLLVPLALTFIVSFWERAGLKMRPAFTLASFEAIVSGARLVVLERSLLVAVEATVLSVLIAYPIAYFLARKASAAATRMALMLFTVPFLINYIARNFSWTYLLSRTGPINGALIALGLVDGPIDWLLYSDFAVFIGLISSYMPFMIFPLWLSISGIDQRLLEASTMLGARPSATFWRVTLPLSLPGIFAAVIFGFVGSFGESAVPIIMGGVGYELMGNTIMSSMDVLNYPLAAALSSIVILSMLLLIVCWYLLFDLRTFLGKILRWRLTA